MVEIKLEFEDWNEARRVEENLALFAQMMNVEAEDRGALLDAAVQMHEQLFELMEKEDG